MYGVAVTLSAERAQIGTPLKLFDRPGGVVIFATSPDATRFLAIKQPRLDPPREIVVVEHWLEHLNRD